MPLEGEYEPSPEAWVRDQVALYESTDGALGTTLRGVPVVVITSRGAKSGKLRKNPVMRVEHEGSYAAVASKGGAPEHPVWYYNFIADPIVQLQDGPEPALYKARLLEPGPERDEWWARCCDAYEPYIEYQTKTDRLIPVFLLEKM
jgi:deazaflavin-dependent oxidoreductase (nitroreductase family)